MVIRIDTSKAAQKTVKLDLRKKPKKTLAKRVAALERNRPEMKNFYRTALSGAIPSWNGSLITLAESAQGVSNIQHIGDHVRVKRITLKLLFGLPSTPTDLETFRVMLIRDKANGIASAASLLQESGTVFAPQSPLADDIRKDFVVMYDKWFTVGNYAGANPFRQITIDKKCDFDMVFDTGTSNIIRNEPYIVIYGDASAPTTVWYGKFHVRYIDN